MKQLSQLGRSRHGFFRNPRTRLRSLRPGEDGTDDLLGPHGYGYMPGEFS